jgi:hypothetical protein
MKQLFKNLNLDNFRIEDISKSIQEDAATSIQENNSQSDVNLTFKWTENRNILFYMLHLKVNNKSVDLLNGASINDATGNHTFFIGSFDNNTEIEISFGILALVSIPKIIALMSQTNPIVGFQASPKDPGKTNKIESGDKLEETFKYKVQ